MSKGVGLCLGAICAILMGLSACDKDDDDNNDGIVNQTDMDFVMMASMSNYAEISAGQVAKDKAQNEGIAEFGEMMVMDHTEAGQDLKSLVSNLGLTTRDSLDAAHVMLMDTLESLSGRNFDSVYIHSQVRDHQMAISIFQNEADNGQHRDLKAFAEDMLPHLQMHLQHADSLRMNY